VNKENKNDKKDVFLFIIGKESRLWNGIEKHERL
jgi:hypothetical protein